ncbi:MAG TPA: polymer-forming cytoskeletal protein [Burkholderiales bacterium]|nr:polymer-forming cytoskeletal protein [Burkholderiales bacterium]
MFGFLRTRPDRIDTLIGPGIRVEGDLAFSGGLRIDGEVHGNVIAASEQPSVLVIGATGRVQGEIRATRMVVSGVVSGSIHASELLELHPGARISGELRYGALEVHPGAVLEVELRREVPAPAPAAAPQALATPSTVATTAAPKPIERPARGLIPTANAA